MKTRLFFAVCACLTCLTGFAQSGPPVITQDLTNLTVVAGQTATFTVSATGSAPLTYQWQLNGANIPGASSTSFSITNAQPANDGNYDVLVANAFGEVTSSVAQLNVVVGYSVVLPPGDTLIGNPLDNGNNAANLVLPNPDPNQDYSGPYDTDALLVNTCGAGFQVVYFDSVTTDTTTGFVDGGGNPTAAPILSPGCAFFFVNETGARQTNVFTGTVPTPVLPPPCYCGTGVLSYFSLQGTNTGTFQSLTGFGPANGDELVTYNGGGPTTNTFLNGAWTGGTPVLNPAVGYGVMPIEVQYDYIVCPTNIVITSCTNVPIDYLDYGLTYGSPCCTNHVTVSCTPTNGSWFAPGTVTKVCCTVSDDCDSYGYGCGGAPASCCFTVTVLQGTNCVSTTNCCAGCVAPYPDSYSVTVYPGENYLADDLCQGTNDTIADVLPSVPPRTRVEIWNPVTQSYISDTYGAGGWNDPSLTLSPGEGFILDSPVTTNFTLTISGCQPTCPPPCLPSINGFVLVGAFGTNTATWSNLSSCPPVCGTEVTTFNPQTQQSITDTYINGVWAPSAPVLGVGQSAFVSVHPNSNCCTNGVTNLVLNTGYNPNTAAPYSYGDADALWWVTKDPTPGTTVPRPSTVIEPNPAWKPAQPESAWISSYQTEEDNLNGEYDYATYFCTAPGATNLELSICLRADDVASASLNGHAITLSPAITTFKAAVPACGTVVDPSWFVIGGQNVLTIYVTNLYGVAMGVNAEVSVTGQGLIALGTAPCCEFGSGLSGQKFYDENCDGQQQPWEPGVPGWTIQLSNGQTAQTDANGYYYFTNLPPGTYTVSEVPEPGWTQSAPASGTYTVTLGPLDQVNGLNFGNCRTTTNTNCVSIDCPTNIVVDCSEDGAVVYFTVNASSPCGNNPVTVNAWPPSGTLFPVGTTLVTASAHDSQFNWADCTFTVTVNPALQVSCSTNKTVACNSNWTFDLPTATSCCGTNITITTISTVTNGTCPKVITQTWQVSDSCSNSTVCQQTVTVQNNTPPVINCPSNIVVSSCTSVPVCYNVTASSACCSNVTVTCTPPSCSSFGPGTVTTVICTADDCCGNSNSCSFTVTVINISAPELLCSNLTITCGSPVPTNPPAWTDQCCTNVEVTLVASTNYGSGCSQGIVIQTWQAVDLCYGTTDLCTRSITIEPSPPELLCSNITVACGAPIPTNPPAWFDACCSNVVVSLVSSSTSSNGCNPVITRVWQAVDKCCGLSDTCTQLVTLGSIGTPIVTVIHTFGVTSIGSTVTPQGPLLQGSDGNFYGTTGGGGTYGDGTVFRMTPSGTVTVLYNFGSSATDGQGPNGGLVQDSAGNLYGTTVIGGANNNNGTVFMLSPSGPGYTETILHSFDNADGSEPNRGLLRDSAGNLYGTTVDGGAYGAIYQGFGTVFELSNSVSGFTFKTLYNFNTSDGWHPYCTLLRDSAGNLWGTTSSGGAYAGGTVFELRQGASGYTLTTQHNFNPTGGGEEIPYAGLMQASDGNYYGTFSFGGSVPNAYGGVFRIIPGATSPNNYKLMCTFPASGVNYPLSVPVEGCDGNLYVTTEDTGNVEAAYPGGGVYAVNLNSGSYTLVAAFSGANQPVAPTSGLLLASDGNFYGTTSNYGSSNDGTIFRMCGPCCASAALSIGTFGGNTLLSWPPGGAGAEPWQVQSSTDLLNWATFSATNVVSPLLINPTGQLQFFRLIQTNLSN